MIQLGKLFRKEIKHLESGAFFNEVLGKWCDVFSSYDGKSFQELSSKDFYAIWTRINILSHTLMNYRTQEERTAAEKKEFDLWFFILLGRGY